MESGEKEHTLKLSETAYTFCIAFVCHQLTMILLLLLSNYKW